MPYHRSGPVPAIHDTYRCEDRSLVLRWLRDPVLMPIVRSLPPSVTPNQLTIVGHAAMWASAAVALLTPASGRIGLLILAAGCTIFNLADTLDGLYARHSGRTSRLGELLDHGLDPMSLGLVLLTYGIVMREPPALVVASTAIVASLQFLTYLHGYRIGYVVLGEIGIIEGLAVAALICVAGAAGAYEWLTEPDWFGVSPASLLAIAVIVGALPAFVSMRGLLDNPGDIVPLAVLETIALAWFGVGELGAIAGGVLVLSIAFLQSMIVTTSRLRRQSLALTDLPFTALLLAAMLASALVEVDGRWQRLMALALAVYSCARAARLLMHAAAAAEQQPRYEVGPVGP
jgi:phosphatidylglycerophosphate synthase